MGNLLRTAQLTSLATHLPAPLLDGVDGQRALDAPLSPQEHLSLVCLVELRLRLGLGGVHAQADHLAKGNSSSGMLPGRVCSPNPALLGPGLRLLGTAGGAGAERGQVSFLITISRTPLGTTSCPAPLSSVDVGHHV